MTRIRYKKEANILKAGPFKTPDNELNVQIIENGLVAIYNKIGGIIYDDRTMTSSIKSRTPQNAKKFAKKALQSLGVVFQEECRPRIRKQNQYPIIDLSSDGGNFKMWNKKGE